MNLHDRIMALEPIGAKSQVSKIHFNNAKMRAAQLATEADELMMQLGNALASVDPDQLTIKQQDSFTSALTKYSAYKEQLNEQ